VVNALLAEGQYAVRVLTRKPESDKARTLAERGVEIVKGDLAVPETLKSAFEGAHGAFLVTNFWDPGTGRSETEQGRAAVAAAKTAGVGHLVWSTLPNCRAISNGRFEVAHFTSKALVDEAVSEAGFARHTFVEAPMYFQNLLAGVMAPQPIGDKKAWSFPMPGDSKTIHAGDVSELGKLVARVFAKPEAVERGQHLSMCGGLYSWQEMVDTLNEQGHDVVYRPVPADQFDGLFAGAAELRETMQYWVEYTYFGPDHEAHVAAANALVPEGFTGFAEWAKTHI
jgi:uncharacterized protein YbjT (DUF2867 family)